MVYIEREGVTYNIPPSIKIGDFKMDPVYIKNKTKIKKWKGSNTQIRRIWSKCKVEYDTLMNTFKRGGYNPYKIFKRLNHIGRTITRRSFSVNENDENAVKMYIEILYFVSETFRYFNRYEDSLYYSNLGLSYALSSSSPIPELEVRLRIPRVKCYTNLGDYENAIYEVKTGFEAIKKIPRKERKEIESELHNVNCSALFTSNEHSPNKKKLLNAMKSIKRAKKHYLKEDRKSEVDYLTWQEIRVTFAQGKCPDDEIISEVVNSYNYRASVWTKFEKAKSLLFNGEITSAKRIINECIKDSQWLGNKNRVVYGYIFLSDVERISENWNAAIRWLHKAEEMDPRITDFNWKKRTINYLKNCIRMRDSTYRPINFV